MKVLTFVIVFLLMLSSSVSLAATERVGVQREANPLVRWLWQTYKYAVVRGLRYAAIVYGFVMLEISRVISDITEDPVYYFIFASFASVVVAMWCIDAIWDVMVFLVGVV